METAAAVLKSGLIVWLFLLIGVVLLKALTGEIRLNGLFREQGSPGNAQDTPAYLPSRVQSLIAFLLIIGGYALLVLDSGPVMNAENKPSLPDVPESLLAVLVGSNGLYLAGKLVKS